MRVVVTGATGMIGLALADALRARGDEVVGLSRDQQRGQRVLGDAVEVHAWTQPNDEPPPEAALRGADAVVHLPSAGPTSPSAVSGSHVSAGRVRWSPGCDHSPTPTVPGPWSRSRRRATTVLAVMRPLTRTTRPGATFWPKW